jgi:hypothetical protein
MSKPPFEEIWKRIIAYQGKTFRTVKGIEFTYMIKRFGLHPSAVRYRIDVIDLKMAYKLVPIKDPKDLFQKVTGPHYVWAVLHDTRISAGKW